MFYEMVGNPEDDKELLEEISPIFHVDKIKNRSNVWKFKCMGYVEKELVVEAIITAMIIMADNK